MKKLSLVVLIVFALVVGSAFALVILVNPNQFKPLLVNQVKQKTGLDLKIEGDISWQFFPAIGFELGKTELKNPSGFTSVNLFKVDEVGIDISLLGLMDHKLEIGEVRVEGAEVHIETLQDGSSNIDALTLKKSSEPQADTGNVSVKDSATVETAQESNPTDKVGENKAHWDVSLAGIEIVNALLDIQNQQTQSYTKLHDVQLNLTEFAVGEWSNLRFGAKGQHNQQQFALSGSTQIRLAEEPLMSALKETNITASYSDGQVAVKELKLSLPTFSVGQASGLNYQVEGSQQELNFNAQGKASVLINQSLTKASVDQLTLDATVEGNPLPQSPLNINIEAKAAYDAKVGKAQLWLDSLKANDLQWQGQASVELLQQPKIRFALSSPNLDLDAFLGNETASNTQPQSAKESSTDTESSANMVPVTKEANHSNTPEPNLTALNDLDVAGSVKIAKLKAQNMSLQDVDLDMAILGGQVKLNHLNANLYQGSLKLEGTLDARQAPAHYVAKGAMEGVKVLPLLHDVAKKDLLEGTGNVAFDLSGSGLTTQAIKQNLDGTVAINFADGAINGINIPHLIRTTYARIKGEKVPDSETKKTDFSALSATLKFTQGNLSTQDLQMQSPLLRIAGQGHANYIKQTMDMLFRTSIVGSLEGQGGKTIDDLRDVTIPLRIYGTWEQPKFGLKMDDVMKKKAQKELDRGLKKLDDKIKDEKTKKAVNSLLKGLFH